MTIFRQKYLFLGLLLAALGTLGACLSWPDEGPSSVSSTDAQPRTSAETKAPAPPNIPRPEERERYLQAVIEGDRRAIALMDVALEQARAGSNVAPEHIEKLEALRRERALRQARYTAEHR